MSTLTNDIYDQSFDLEKVHPGTCLSVDERCECRIPG